MNISEKLFTIQQNVKATKSEYNSFGKYSYRSAEGIIESIKPVLAATQTYIILSDEMKEVGSRIYVEATATLFDIESEASISTKAFARESEEKKGMDESQITGAASSYARKYALSGLLLLDDNKDADSDEYTAKTQEKSKSEPQKASSAPAPIKTYKCADCKKLIKEHMGASAGQIAEATKKKYGRMLCVNCAAEAKAKQEAEQGELPFDLGQ